MTEAEWLASSNVEKLLEQVLTGFPRTMLCEWAEEDRKSRLFIIACADRIWRLLPEEYQAVIQPIDPQVSKGLKRGTLQMRWSAARRVGWEFEDLLHALNQGDIAFYCERAAAVAETQASVRFEQQAQAALLRDIFGYPFRPVTLDPAWRTPTVTSLAQAIYADRRFADLPILADALEDAGCANAAILDHCRQPGEHVRGCWVVDLVLAKS